MPVYWPVAKSNLGIPPSGGLEESTACVGRVILKVGSTPTQQQRNLKTTTRLTSLKRMRFSPEGKLTVAQFESKKAPPPSDRCCSHTTSLL